LKKAIKDTHGTESDEIFGKLTKNKETDDSFINNVAEILEKAQEILGKTSSDEANKLLSKFNEKLSATGGDEIKKLINTHIKKNSKGYVDAALEHAKKPDMNVAKIIEESGIEDAKSSAEAKTSIDKMRARLSDLSGSEKEIVEKKSLPRAELMKKFFDGSQSEKDLVPILKIFIKKANVESNFSTENDLKELKEKLDKLNEYKKGSDYGKLDSTHKTTFDALVKEIETKVEALDKQFNTSNNPTDDKGGFLKS